MKLKIIACRLVPFIWIAIASCSLALTLFGMQPPRFMSPVVHLMYQASSPFQGYSTQTKDIKASGTLLDGSVVQLDLQPYFPYTRGSRVVRLHFWTFELFGKAEVEKQFKTLAYKILQNQRYNAVNLASLTLVIESWAMSVDGFEALHTPELTTTLYTTTVQ